MRVILCDHHGVVLQQVRGATAGVPLLAEHGLEAGHIEFEPDAAAGQHREISELRQRHEVVVSDRVHVRPGDPAWPARREKLLCEHTHADFELRIFVDGRGLFQVRLPAVQLVVLCEAGDWLLIPAEVPHRFDGGRLASFDMLRLFSLPLGWASSYTDAKAPTLPLLDDLVGTDPLRSAMNGGSAFRPFPGPVVPSNS